MEKLKFNSVDKLFIFFFGFLIVSSFPVNLFRLSGVSFVASAYILIVFVCVCVLMLLSVVISMRKPLPQPSFLIALMLFCVYIFTVGVLKGNADPISGLRYYILPFAVYGILIFRKFPVYFYTATSFWAVVVAFHLLGFLYYSVALSGSIYPGIGVPSIAYSAIYFFSIGSFVPFSLSLLLVLLEGKRSILLSLIVVLFFVRLVNQGWGKRLFYFIFTMVLLVVFLVVALKAAASIEGYAVISRINYINPFSSRFDIMLGSSGRAGELVSFFSNLDIQDWILGSGAGFDYVWDLGYASSQAGEVKGYFHISVANYIAAGGVFGVFVFVMTVFLSLRVRGLNAEPRIKKVIFGFSAFAIVQSFFGFNLATDPVTWMFILAPVTLLSFKRHEVSFRSSCPGD